jgi:hypothetical protein
MNINSEFASTDQAPCPTEVVELALNYFAENLLAPMIDDLDQEQLLILSTIGESLRIMAQDAKAWGEHEKIFSKN